MSSSALFYDRPKVGGDILTWCTRCKMDLAHVVMAMEGSTPARVQCKTCRSDHNYRKPTGITSPRASKPRTTTPKTTIRAAEIWEQKLAGRHQEDVRNYSVQDSYKVNELIQHPQFGLGVVEQVRSPQKVSILFKLGERLLVHGMKG